MNCFACDAELEADGNSTYQFENALWVGFFGGYGMFVDNIDAQFPINTHEQWLYKRDGETPRLRLHLGKLRIPVPSATWELLTRIPSRNLYKWKLKHLRMIDNPEFKPEYKEDVPLDADYAAVICHECAHELCTTVPWVEKLIHSHNSHSHKTSYHETYPDHFGWDYSKDI